MRRAAAVGLGKIRAKDDRLVRERFGHAEFLLLPIRTVASRARMIIEKDGSDRGAVSEAEERPWRRSGSSTERTGKSASRSDASRPRYALLSPRPDATRSTGKPNPPGPPGAGR